MARESLAIGDTGEELVSKFNGNFIQTFTDNNAYFYNVETYGAVHDGVTDDTEAIQLAINTCFAAGGGTVFFPNGTYIIAGALQNDVGENAVDYNSQIYIPELKPADGRKVIKLLGEINAWGPYTTDSGVILKSTIAGSGTWPSVICSRARSTPYEFMNYCETIIENITVLVNEFIGTTGPSMCGINMLYSSHPVLKRVSVGVDHATYAEVIKPTAHVFGIGIGLPLGDHPVLEHVTARGFYYGIIAGEGTCAQYLVAQYNYIGLMILNSYYGVVIQHCDLHWNAYHIASLQEQVLSSIPTSIYYDCYLKIMYAIIEDGYEGDDRTPAWCRIVAHVLDSDYDMLYGEMTYNASTAAAGTYLTKSGGTNFLIKNIHPVSNYHWTTATRPSDPGIGLTGYNETTNKLESYIVGTGWVDLH